jgi:hypothetical protein
MGCKLDVFIAERNSSRVTRVTPISELRFLLEAKVGVRAKDSVSLRMALVLVLPL